jgi:hypothetical protein
LGYEAIVALELKEAIIAVCIVPKCFTPNNAREVRFEGPP